MTTEPPHLPEAAKGDADPLADALAAAFSTVPEVVAVALGGSRPTGAADAASDIDLYVYATAEVPLAFRAGLAGRHGVRVETDNRVWETGDEWVDARTGMHVDLTYRSPGWAEDQLASVLDRHEARLGYTTCIWHNLATSRSLFDRTGWFARLQIAARRPYPDALVEAIRTLNHPVLRERHGAYRNQILKAAGRRDGVSVNHRVAAFLASYFDVLFAANRTPHSGEKRLLAAASALEHAPPGLTVQVERLLAAAATSSVDELDGAIGALCDGLDGKLDPSPPVRAQG